CNRPPENAQHTDVQGHYESGSQQQPDMPEDSQHLPVLVQIVKQQVEMPVQELLSGLLLPHASSIQQDVSGMLEAISATSGTATVEKAGLDAELQRLQRVLADFQARIAQVSG
ncbi:hypothetical protein HaLaN_09846, partial [Haematococcus lacustris]